MRVIYLFDMDGWALEDIGRGLDAVLSGSGIEVVLLRRDRWLASPVPGDVLYWGWSGMIRPTIDTRRHAPRRLTTIHDPQEISHFENRPDWHRYPAKPLHWLDAVDGVSVISEELRRSVAERYGLDCPRTPTWPSRWRTLRAAQDRPDRPEVKVVSSTKLSAHFSAGEMLGRLRHWPDYLVDSRRRLAPAQLLGALVRTRRKNLPVLNRLAREFAGHPGIRCEFHSDRPHFADREAYERWLADADVYVCASHMEGGPLPVMEAVLSGLAVVTTPVGQVDDWVEDGRNGFVVTSERELRSAVRQYAADRGLLRRHQGASREIAGRFSPRAEPWVRFFSGVG